MNQLHFQGHLWDVLKGFTTTGILGLAIAGAAWGQTSADPSQQPPAAPAASTSEAPLTALAAKSSPDDSYVIGNSDLLSINVWKEPGLTETVPVRTDGKISLPLIGEINASGRTPLQLKEEITAKLRDYITAPDVTVIVQQVNSQKFNVLGRVVKPGSYPLSATTTVLDAIAQAGGFLDFAKQKGIYILRRDPQGRALQIHFDYKDVIRGKHPEQNIKLLPQDTVVVP